MIPLHIHSAGRDMVNQTCWSDRLANLRALGSVRELDWIDTVERNSTHTHMVGGRIELRSYS